MRYGESLDLFEAPIHTLPDATAEALPEREQLVLNLLKDGAWHSTAEFCSVRVGGTEGMRRLRYLRARGYVIEKRKKLEGTQYEYRLVRLPHA